MQDASQPGCIAAASRCSSALCVLWLSVHTSPVASDTRDACPAPAPAQALEMPQKGRKKKVAKRKGQATKQAIKMNKDCITVMMTWDLSGFNYGVQLVLKRKEITDDMAVEAPREVSLMRAALH